MAIEQSCTKIPLQCVPWLRSRLLGTLRHHPLIGANLRVVQQSHLFSKTDGEITRLYPVLGNPAFPPGHTDSCFKQTLKQGKFCLGDNLEESRLKTRVEIQLLFNPPLDLWRIQQLTHFLSSLLRGERSDSPNTSLENLCLIEAPSAHGVSEVNKLLTYLLEGSVPSFLRKWERDLDITLSKEQQSYTLYFAHYSSTASKYEELCYKICTRW